MKIKFPFHLGLFCLFFTTAAWGEPLGQPKELLDLIARALANNPELKAAQSELQMVKARVGPAGSLEDPMLSWEAMNVPVDSWRLSESELSLVQKFPFPGKRRAEEDLATLRVKATEKRVHQRQLDAIRDIERLYYSLYLIARKKDILNSQKSILRQALASSRNLYVLNKIPQVVILNLQIEEARLVDEELKLSSETKEFEAELVHLTGHSVSQQPLRFEPIKASAFDFSAWNDTSISQAVRNQSGELQALQLEITTADQASALAEKGYLPDFEVMASYTRRDPIQGIDGMTRTKNLVSAKIGLTLPIWGSNKQDQLIQEARAGKERAQFVYEDAQLMLIHKAQALLAELKESRQRLDLFESGLLQLSEQALASGKSAYITGKLEYTGLLDTLKRHQDIAYGYQEALVAFAIQRSKLEALVGQKLGISSHDSKH